MKSFATPDFWEAYAKLSPEEQEKVQKAYRLWRENLQHPSLHFKNVGKNLWSAQVSRGYRVLALKQGDDYYWFWVGCHEDYMALIRG